MLNDKDIETIKTKLSVPLVINDILGSDGHVTSDLRYALHEAISDFQPDSALLCFAFSIRSIVAVQPYLTNGLKLLNLECERVIEDYAPLWLEHVNNESIDPTLVFETLAALPEDLETIAELMALELPFLQGVDTKSAELFDVLYAQAKAHALIAEQYVDVMESTEQRAENNISDFITAPAAMLPHNDNVIPFPGGQVRG